VLEGVEWNVRLSAIATPPLMQKFSATFETYWNDSTFESYDPDRDRDRLDDALAEASGRKQTDRVTLSLSGLEVRAYPHQAEILESLTVERVVHDRHRNLVVAATGTGKTVIAALDYQRLCTPSSSERPSLLFVAHREEILKQSLRTYREVLSDPNFGELYGGGARPERWRHVFASVQSLRALGSASLLPTPSTWLRSSTRQASPPSRSQADPDPMTAQMPCPDWLLETSTPSSQSTCSMRESTSLQSTPSSSSDRQRVPPSSCNSWVAAFVALRTNRFSPRSTSSVLRTRSS